MIYLKIFGLEKNFRIYCFIIDLYNWIVFVEWFKVKGNLGEIDENNIIKIDVSKEIL